MISGGAYARIRLLTPSLIAEAVPSRRTPTTRAIANRSHLLLSALDGGVLKTLAFTPQTQNARHCRH